MLNFQNVSVTLTFDWNTIIYVRVPGIHLGARWILIIGMLFGVNVREDNSYVPTSSAPGLAFSRWIQGTMNLVSTNAFFLCGQVKDFYSPYWSCMKIIWKACLSVYMTSLSSVSPCGYDSVFLGRCQAIFWKPLKICSDGIVNTKGHGRMSSSFCFLF